jgi:1,4-alpha-glucan branching enzyme
VGRRLGVAEGKEAVAEIVQGAPRFLETLGQRVEDAVGRGRILDSDETRFGGASYNRQDRVASEQRPSHGYPFRLRLNLPPLGALFYQLAR